MSHTLPARPDSRGFLIGAISALFAIGLYVNIGKVLLGSRALLLATDVMILALCAVVAALWLSGRARAGAVELLIVAFTIVGTLELFHPNVPSILLGMEGYRRLIFQMLGFLVGIVAIRKRDDILFLWKLLAICAVPILLYSIKQFFVISDFDQALIESTAADMDTWQIFGKIRSFGLFSGPFHLGIFAGLIFWIAVALRAETRSRWFTWLAALAVCACVASLTRASLIALLVSIPVVLVFVLRHARGRVIAIALTVLITGVAGFYVAKATSSTVASVVEGYSLLESLQNDGRLQGRFEDYSHAIKTLADYPLGAGMGSASDAMGAHFAAANGLHITSHNLFLWVGLETGLIGLLLFIGILFSIFLAARKLVALDDRPLAMAAFGALVVILISGLTGSTLSAYPVNLIFWTLSGCYVGYLRTLEWKRKPGVSQ